MALLTLKGRNEDKVKFSAEHLKREIERFVASGGASVLASRADILDFDPSGTAPHPEGVIRDLQISGPAPAPLLRAENFYRHQIMLRTRAMSRLSRSLAKIIESLTLPDDVTLAVDIDPVNLS